MKGVWEEVRLEAVGIVENEPSSTVPSFLTLDLFSELSFESIVSALSSLSSFITAKPSPADTIASCAVLFLHKLKIDVEPYITVSSFPVTFARTLPPILATENEQLFDNAVDLLKSTILHIGRDRPERMAEHGLFVKLMDVLRMKKAAESHPQEEGCGKIETRNWINAKLTNVVKGIIATSLSLFTSSSRSNSFHAIDADADTIARIVLEKILEPCEGFIATSLRACLNSLRPLNVFDDMIHLVQTACRVESQYSLLSEFVERNGFYLVLMKVFDSAESKYMKIYSLCDIEWDQFTSTPFEGFREAQPDDERTTEVQRGGEERRKRLSVRGMMRGRNEEGNEDGVEHIMNLLITSWSDSERLDRTLSCLGTNVASREFNGRL